MVVAGRQRAGRGRLGRTWVSPPGASLLASVLLRPGLDSARLHLVTAAVGLAAAEACEQVAGGSAELKWPNDVVVDDRKLGGLLAEVDGEAVVVGVGVNVNWPAEDLEPLAATALNHLAGTAVDDAALLDWLLSGVDGWYGRWDDVAAAYRRRCTTLGRRVRVELLAESFTGTAVDLDGAGNLMVDVGTTRRTVTAGDVVHLRDDP